MKMKSIISTLALLTLCFTFLQAEEGNRPICGTGMSPYFAKNGPVTLSHLQLSCEGNLKVISWPMVQMVVRPGSEVEGVVEYFYDARAAATYSLNQIIIGIDGVGAQDCLMNELGKDCGGGEAVFTLTAPEEAGTYDIRFRYAQGNSIVEAVEGWWEVDGAPGGDATIGRLIVAEE
ncbi:MAG: hypothetical protein K940chlam2_00927 [Chlamydiae bacterium]|nr:hypothetical protein [Chlamydiota bacterium]